MKRESTRSRQKVWEQITRLNTLLSELLEEMATGDAPKTWAKVMAFLHQTEVTR